MYRIRGKTNKLGVCGPENGTGSVAYVHDSSAPSAGFDGCVAKTGDEIRARQHLANELPLHADPAPVNDAQCAKTETARLDEVLLHYGLYVARRHRMQIEHVGDRNADRVLIGVHGLETKKPGPTTGTGPKDYRRDLPAFTASAPDVRRPAEACCG